MEWITKTISLLFLFFVGQHLFSQTADIILTNGKIFTADDSKFYVQALAIKGNKIIATGTDADIAKLAGSTTKRIDIEGKTVVPGFNDAHDHLGWLSPVGVAFTYNEFKPAGLDKKTVLDSLTRSMKIAKPGQWVVGWIGTDVFFDTSMRASLDSIAPHNPVVLQNWWGHGQVVNKKALEVSGLSDKVKDPVGGRYIRNSGNKINSIHENAQVPVWNAWFGSELGNQIKGLRSYSQEQLKVGVTTVQNMSSTFNAEQSIRFFEAAKLDQRIRVIAWPLTTSFGRHLAKWNIKSKFSSPLIYTSGIKYMIDGTPFEQNSYNKKTYQENGQWYGWLNYPVDTIRQILKEALSGNKQLMMHITGDSTMAIVISLMKELASGEVWKTKRVRIEHNSTPYITASEVNDIKKLGLLMMHTPKYCQSSPIRSLIEEGITVGISPDGTTNPFWEIMIITSQQNNPDENISREQAVIAYTKTNAYAEFAEKEKGTLSKGMLADLVVLSQDIFTISIQQLPATTSLLTMVNGKIVYHRSDQLTIK
jgi:predicted amidohydrolase YtcJ